jgi:hypothetical protein
MPREEQNMHHQPDNYNEPVYTEKNDWDDDWDEELNLEDSQVVTDVASACRIGDPDCESCQ